MLLGPLDHRLHAVDELSTGEPSRGCQPCPRCRDARRCRATCRPRISGPRLVCAMNRAPTAPSDRLELARAAYREISLYAPDRSPCEVDLSDNTNLFGAPPTALHLLREAAVSSVTRYPSLYTAELKAAIAKYAGTRSI